VVNGRRLEVRANSEGELKPMRGDPVLLSSGAGSLGFAKTLKAGERAKVKRGASNQYGC
jgi:hypothetical protein